MSHQHTENCPWFECRHEAEKAALREQLEQFHRQFMEVSATAAKAVQQSTTALDHRDRTCAALRLVLARCRDPNAPAGESFERVAEEYWHETGQMAPGKDESPYAGGSSPEERRARFDEWERRKWAEAWAAAKKVLG